MKTKYLLNDESARMATFRLLSDCYYLPDSALFEKLDALENHMATVCESALGYIQKMRIVFQAGGNMEALKVDFSKLFVGPYKLFAAPYGSVYLDGERKVMGNSTLDVKSRYREAGLDTASHFKDAPDHISAELEFMYYLIFKEVEALSDLDIETAIGFIQKQKSFLEDHLMAWVPQLADSIIKQADTPFYPNLAKATVTFLEENYKIVCALLDLERLKSEKDVEISTLRV